MPSAPQLPFRDGVGARLHEESLQLQRSLAAIPLPREGSRRHARPHPVRHLTLVVLVAALLVAASLLLLPPGNVG